jgi:hypothetical protein
MNQSQFMQQALHLLQSRNCFVAVGPGTSGAIRFSGDIWVKGIPILEIKYVMSYQWMGTVNIGGIDIGATTEQAIKTSLQKFPHVWVDCLAHMSNGEAKKIVITDLMGDLYAPPRRVIVPQQMVGSSCTVPVTPMLSRGWIFQEQILNPVSDASLYNGAYLRELLARKLGILSTDGSIVGAEVAKGCLQVGVGRRTNEAQIALMSGRKPYNEHIFHVMNAWSEELGADTATVTLGAEAVLSFDLMELGKIASLGAMMNIAFGFDTLSQESDRSVAICGQVWPTIFPTHALMPSRTRAYKCDHLPSLY